MRHELSFSLGLKAISIVVLDSGIGAPMFQESGSLRKIEKRKSLPYNQKTESETENDISILETFRGLVIIQAHSERQNRQNEMKERQIPVTRRTKSADDGSEHYEDDFDTESDGQSDSKDGDLYRPPPRAIKSNTALNGRPHAVITTSLVKYDAARHPSTRDPGNFTQPVQSPAKRSLNTTQGESPPKKRRCGRPTKAEALARAAAASLTSEDPPLLSSIRKYTLERSPPSKRQRKPEPTPKGAKRTRPLTRRDDSTLPSTPVESGPDRVFQTCLENNKTIVFLFAPLTISFQHFYFQFCKSWRKSKGEMEVEDIDVKITISNLGEYRLSFGKDRGRSWTHIMKIAESGSESDILVTLVGQVAAITE